jgi:hypothetical protein
MFDAADLAKVAAEYLGRHFITWRHSSNARCTCLCGDNFLSEDEWALHAAEIAVSALTFELQSLLHDQK